MNSRPLVVVSIVRLVRVQMEERRGRRIQLHAETHEQDKEEPLHLGSIVADISPSVKKAVWLGGTVKALGIRKGVATASKVLP